MISVYGFGFPGWQYIQVTDTVPGFGYRIQVMVSRAAERSAACIASHEPNTSVYR